MISSGGGEQAANENLGVTISLEAGFDRLLPQKPRAAGAGRLTQARLEAVEVGRFDDRRLRRHGGLAKCRRLGPVQGK